ncbi:MAG TPA: TolC family protein, partial [Dissulfurispiraceae bacterium]|nr:TolC family protein [Dissulfurispiraceae bacterium]
NRLILITARNKDIALSDLQIARSRLLPTVNTSLSQTILAYQPAVIIDTGLGARKVPTSEKGFLSYSITAYQTLYDFGARSSLYEASKVSLERTGFDIERTKNLVALDFIIAYFDLLEAEKLILVAQREVESIRSHLNVARSLYEEGAITKNDLLQADVRLSDATQRLMAVRNSRAVIAARLCTILSRSLRDDIEVAEAVSEGRSGPDLDAAWRSAEEQRAELKIIDREVRVSELEETAKRSEYFPTFFAQGGFDYSENRFQVHEKNWSFIAGMNLNLFSGGATKAEATRIGYRREQLLEQRRKLLDDIQLEVKRNYLDRETARERIGVTRDAVGQANENLRINRVRYEEGVGTATDVLDAIALLTVAETNSYRATYELRRAEAALFYATGTDLVSLYSR